MVIPKSISTSVELHWHKDDQREYPWLRKTTRYYSLEHKLDEGTFGTAYVGHPLARFNGNNTSTSAPLVVVKLPKIDRIDYTIQANRARLDYIRIKNNKEFLYLRRRLHGCIHANAILDLAVHHDEDLELPVTIQLYINDALPLNKWLVAMKFRDALTDPALTGITPPTTPWTGISDRTQWVNVARPIAIAIREIHLRRVSHGDIHPGNIFLTTTTPYIAKLIDFGEGFTATPDLNWRERNPRSFVAPERLGPRFPLNEQIDIYSFGILLLFLAIGDKATADPSTGNAIKLPWASHPGLHRSYINDLIRQLNPFLVRDEPRISDLIGRLTAKDPVDRPQMVDVCEELSAISKPPSSVIVPTDLSSIQILKSLTKEVADGAKTHNPVLLNILHSQIRDLQTTFSGLKTEMVELNGTRDKMLRVMISLLEHLQAGDSWTTATTLAAWQHRALGLNGSYASANIRAIRRDVAVRRTFIISIAELGLDFANQFVTALEKSNDHALHSLAGLFKRAIRDFNTKSANANYVPPSIEFEVWHRRRLLSLVEFLDDIIRDWDLSSYIAPDRLISIENSHGLYVGICPVATLDDVGAIRENNPVSLMHFAKEEADERKWLLVATEMRGRNENRDGIDKPHLLGVRVYKSVMGDQRGKPTDRIRYLQDLMNKDATNISHSIPVLRGILFELLRRF